jgi:two-component system LytT family response regulator
MTKELNITAILVDDAPQARELLKLMINELTPNVKIIGEAENVDDAISLIQNTKPDVVFLDIHMPGKSGLELLEELAKNEAGYEVIFTTAYNQYAIQAFRLSAIDYLLKPIQENELIDAVEKVVQAKKLKHDSDKLNVLINNLKEKNNGTLAIPVNYGYEYLPISEIEFIEAERSYAQIHLQDGTKKLVSKPLGYFEDILQHLDNFIKTHRSYFINISYISAFQKKSNTGVIVFKSGKTAEVSRNSRKDFIEKIETNSDIKNSR